MPSRRLMLSLCGIVAASPITGCAALAEARPVDVLLQNDDTQSWELTVAVERESGEEVFRTTETVPADSGEDLGEVSVEDAFEGRPDERFTVRTWLAGELDGTYDYEITCEADNRFSLLVEHRPESETDGEMVDYVPDRCGE